MDGWMDGSREFEALLLVLEHSVSRTDEQEAKSEFQYIDGHTYSRLLNKDGPSFFQCSI